MSMDMIQGFMMNQIFQQLNKMQSSSIELVPGQVLQGKVLKLFPDNLATVQLGGLTVTARLETPLELGQRTWLQVQPGGQPVTLKVISQPDKSNQASEAGVEGLAKALGAPVTKESLSLLQKAVDEGIPLRSDSLRLLQQIAAETGNDQATQEALLLAVKKGLPLTKETVLALRTFAENANIEKGMEELVRSVRHTLGQPELLPPDMKKSLEQLLTRIDSARSTLEQMKNMLLSSETAYSNIQHNKSGQPGILPGRQVTQSDLQMDGTENVFSNTPPNMKQVITELFERLGLTHERNLTQMTGENAAAIKNETENVKSVLLQLLQHPEADRLPVPLREQMQQFVQQVTGQQLMAVSTSGDAAFLQIVLQIPLPGQENSENAFIQVESRRNSRGELDPDNCRLFFYLFMRNIGETMLDVSIVNKILSINLYNDQEGLSNLVSALRVPLEENLREQGYRLSGLRVLSMPEERQEDTRRPISSLSLPSFSLAHYKGVDFRV
jgi:predicted DNA-binding ribbon-helix-helix protein